MTKRRKLLPAGMAYRVTTMAIWLIAAGSTSFGAPEMSASIVVFGALGVGLGLFFFLLWGPRTRPGKNAFWFLVHVVLVGAVIALGTTRPLLGFVTAIPVALLWIHDSPASPTAMLSWGMILVLWQPSLWVGAEAEISWDVVVATLLMIAAAQFERNRLAGRQYTQAGVIFSFIRLGLVAGITMLFVAGREGLRAVNAFTYLGIDASGIGGKLTMLSFIIISLAVALALFRVRPEKAPNLIVADAAPRRPVGRLAEASAVGPGGLDFDAAPARVAKRVDDVTSSTKRMERAAIANREAAAAKRPAGANQRVPAASASKTSTAKPAAKPKQAAPKAKQAASKPGELDFD